jgi:hypothetical protein
MRAEGKANKEELIDTSLEERNIMITRIYSAEGIWHFFCREVEGMRAQDCRKSVGYSKHEQRENQTGILRLKRGGRQRKQ